MAAAKKSAKKASKKTAKKATAKKATAKRATAKKGARKATKKGAKKTARRATSGATAQVVVASKVRERLRRSDARMSGEFVDALNAEVDDMVGRAVERAKGNNRSTVRPQDL